MKSAPTYEELLAENSAMKAEATAMKANEQNLKMRIAYLERMLYGSKSDRLASRVPEICLACSTSCFKRRWKKRRHR